MMRANVTAGRRRVSAAEACLRAHGSVPGCVDVEMTIKQSTSSSTSFDDESARRRKLQEDLGVTNSAERSGRRDYDDGSAGNAAKYDDARADDGDYGGSDDEDDNLSDFSDNNSDGRYGA